MSANRPSILRRKQDAACYVTLPGAPGAPTPAHACTRTTLTVLTEIVNMTQNIPPVPSRPNHNINQNVRGSPWLKRSRHANARHEEYNEADTKANTKSNTNITTTLNSSQHHTPSDQQQSDPIQSNQSNDVRQGLLHVIWHNKSSICCNSLPSYTHTLSLPPLRHSIPSTPRPDALVTRSSEVAKPDAYVSVLR